jgi:hypothetical protein
VDVQDPNMNRDKGDDDAEDGEDGDSGMDLDLGGDTADM